MSPYKSRFVHVNGICLHYLDWGGSGETLLFLTGMGYSAHLFHPFASRFIDKFRVLALTRRGQGESDYPQNGYDIHTLTDDIYHFLAFLEIDEVNLVGHSFAGLELAHFVEKFPDKVLKLIYLDTPYDSAGRIELEQKNPLRGIYPPDLKEEFESVEEYAAYIKYLIPSISMVWNEAWDKQVAFDLEKTAQGKFVEKDTSSVEKQILDTLQKYDHRQANIGVPVLSFDANSSSTPIAPIFYTEEQKELQLEYHKELMEFRKKEMRKFLDDIPHARLVEVPNGHHYCFIAQENFIYDEIRKFLLGANRK